MDRRAFLTALGALGAAMAVELVPQPATQTTATTKGLADASDAVNRLIALPKIQAFSDELEKASGGKVRLAVRLEGEPAVGAAPASDDRFWRFAVAESHPTHHVTFYRFAIDALSGSVYFQDTAEGRLLPYDEWVASELAIA